MQGPTAIGYDVFVADLTAGTMRVAAHDVNGTSPNAASRASSISADGQLVAFSSEASDLVAGDDNNTEDIFVSMVADEVVRLASVDRTGDSTNGRSYSPTLSGNSNYLAHTSSASDISRNDADASPDIYLRRPFMTR